MRAVVVGGVERCLIEVAIDEGHGLSPFAGLFRRSLAQVGRAAQPPGHARTGCSRRVAAV
jgi:hypothetical protein